MTHIFGFFIIFCKLTNLSFFLKNTYFVRFCIIIDKIGYNEEKEVKGGNMSWNKRIKDLRIDHDMGKKELADKLDISERTLTRYESGISEPTISVLIKLSLLFNVSIDYIAGIKDEEAILTPSIKEELEAINKRLDKIVKII